MLCLVGKKLIDIFDLRKHTCPNPKTVLITYITNIDDMIHFNLVVKAGSAIL